MPLSQLPTLLTTAFAALAHWLDRRSAARVPLLLFGILFAKGRRTITSWFRAAGISDDYRPFYDTVCSVGRHSAEMAVSTLFAAAPLLGQGRLRLAIDDTHRPLRPLCRGRRHPPQPQPRTRRR